MTSRRAISAAIALALALPSPARADGDIAAGHKKARQYAACHGIDGKAKLPEAPNLAGQSATYLTIALADYKSGARKNEMMSLIAPKLTDQDIADLSASYASLSGDAMR